MSSIALPTVRPFHCGTQFGDWLSANCDHCRKRYDEDTRSHFCDIDEALMYAYFDTGHVGTDIAERMGAVKHKGRYNWPCSEWEPAEDAPQELRDAHQKEKQ